MESRVGCPQGDSPSPLLFNLDRGFRYIDVRRVLPEDMEVKSYADDAEILSVRGDVVLYKVQEPFEKWGLKLNRNKTEIVDLKGVREWRPLDDTPREHLRPAGETNSFITFLLV